MAEIVLLTQNLDTGGVQKGVALLAETLTQTGHSCTLIVFEENKPVCYPLPDSIRILSVPFVRMDISADNAGEEIFKRRREDLNALIAEVSPDLIFSFEDYHNILSLSLASEARRIVSCRISLHNFYTPEARIHLLPSTFYFERIGSLYAKADAVVCVSRYIEREVRSLCPEAECVTIHNGIDVSYVRSKTLSGPGDPSIVHVGRLHPQKGQADLLKAFAAIADMIPHRLEIFGEGILRGSLEAIAVELGITERVVFFGNTPEPFGQMGNADMVVIPSYQEGFSNTVLEAMACGAGVIAARYGGHEEILHDYGNLFDPGDTEAMAKIMQRFLEDDALRHRLKSDQLRDVREFDVVNTQAAYRRLVDAVLYDTAQKGK